MTPPSSRNSVPPSPKTLPNRPPPPLDWASLTEAYLLRTFAYLPQADLRSVGLVCRNWCTVQKRALKSTQELAVFIGTNAPNLRLWETGAFPASHALDTFNRKIAFSRIDLPKLKRTTVKQFLRVYPKVTHLWLSANIRGKYASQLVAILQGLSSSLVTLHMKFPFRESETDNVSKSAATLKILRAVNALPHLKTLTFDMPVSLIEEDNDGNAISNEKVLSFPVLSHLVEFNLNTVNDAKYLVESFSNFASGNDSLQTIRLSSRTFEPSSWEQYPNLNARLLATFKYLNVRYEVDHYERHHIGRLFPLLTSLTDLKFSMEGDEAEDTTYREVISQLATLKSLKVLKLAIAVYLPPGQPEVPVGFPQLATVRKLTLELYADSHKEDLLAPCYLEWVFPCLEEVNLNFTFRGCSECNLLEEVLTLKTGKRCANKLYARQVDNLKKLLSVPKKKVVTFEWERQFPGKRWSPSELGITSY